MNLTTQREKAEQFRQMHKGPQMLVLPNAWDAASARVLEQVGFGAIATTSSGVAAALGYRDGQQITRDMMVEVTSRITRVVSCPVTVDVEAGYGSSIAEVAQTVRAVIEAGAVGINIEDSTRLGGEMVAVDDWYQVALIKALRELGASLGVPFVINARVDAFLLPNGEPQGRYDEAVWRAHAYLRAGADCVYPIGSLDRDTIARLVKAIDGPVNILAGSPAPDLPELARMGVARVSFAGRLFRSALGHLRSVARELLEQGTYGAMESEPLSNAEFAALFPQEQQGR
jgi:2-methylisocitrate lyase-like PEP mutase family enzyme